eukprot:TRINITY_DN56785_c0_g1_i1.p1 TRINITY_DN56785_c0_g1~~TRINITY_DN56785_c0_g1_i1.p1  ORF type:complete len:677 (+),score=82.82 TRINITY_DN56785_c0_g1_i1:46-2031(+)
MGCCGSSAKPEGEASSADPCQTVNGFYKHARDERSKGLRPSKAHLIAYAKYLGIDVILDRDLVWIAEEALIAPLSADWTVHEDSLGRLFFFNYLTSVSSWTHPLEKAHRDAYHFIVDFRSGFLSEAEREERARELLSRYEAKHQEAVEDCKHWAVHTTSSGKPFYYNSTKQRAFWTDPRLSVAHELNLMRKTLDVATAAVDTSSIKTIVEGSFESGSGGSIAKESDGSVIHDSGFFFGENEERKERIRLSLGFGRTTVSSSGAPSSDDRGGSGASEGDVSSAAPPLVEPSTDAPIAPSTPPTKSATLDAEDAPDDSPVAPAEDEDLCVETVPCEGTVWQSLCQLMYVTDPASLGVGRDVKESESYNCLLPVRAWKITRKTKWEIFDATRRIVAADLKRIGKVQSVPVMETKLDGSARWLGGTCDCNERLLLHGTKPENLEQIIHGGLSEKVSGGLLGHGVYLAEDPSKMDQYATADLGPGTPGLEKLHDLLYPSSHGSVHPGRVFYALVCRVLLGAPVLTKNGRTCLHAPADAVHRSADKRELALVPGSHPKTSYHSLVLVPGPASEGHILQRHREFVAFSSNRVLEEYVIAYQRTTSKEPLQRISTRQILEAEARENWRAKPEREETALERLRKLTELKDAMLITSDEFDRKKQQILDGM